MRTKSDEVFAALPTPSTAVNIEDDVPETYMAIEKSQSSSMLTAQDIIGTWYQWRGQDREEDGEEEEKGEEEKIAIYIPTYSGHIF